MTGTTITVKLHTSPGNTASGFFAAVTGDATVTTDVIGESGLANVATVILNNVSGN